LPGRNPFSVLIAGGGVAAIEAALALRELSEGEIRVQLLAPEPSFWYRPAAVAEPFERGKVLRFDLGHVADAAGAGFALGALAAVAGARSEARTDAGTTIPYDALLIACGAAPTTAVPGAITFRGPTDTDRVRALLKEIEEGEVQRLVFAVPWGSVWALPAYELALLTAARLKAYQTRNVELMLVTPEDAPLQLFGRSASDAVRELLGDADVTLITGTCPIAAHDGRLRTVPEQSIAADRVLALPRLQGHSIHGVPQTVEGFVPVDQHGRVVGLDNVFAAGDITTFPVKQGGIATQQAFVAAEAIAAMAGLAVAPRPFAPVLRGLLLTKSHPLFLRRNMSGADESDWASETPIWWPPTKIVGRRLTPFLAALAGEKVTREEPPPTDALAVEVDLQAQDLERLTTVRFEPQAAELPRADPAPLKANGPATVLDVVHTDPLVIAPEDTLADAASQMYELGVDSALVVTDGSLVGILTDRNFVRAAANRLNAAEALVRVWMTAEPITAPPSMTLTAASLLMREYGIHHLPVVYGNRLVGMVGSAPLVQARPTGKP
jgi:sulfide:quinone oxidoreductase